MICICFQRLLLRQQKSSTVMATTVAVFFSVDSCKGRYVDVLCWQEAGLGIAGCLSWVGNWGDPWMRVSG